MLDPKSKIKSHPNHNYDYYKSLKQARGSRLMSRLRYSTSDFIVSSFGYVPDPFHRAVAGFLPNLKEEEDS
jgi:hypothetical protein